ncbi:hypothetical protein Apa02nite_069810 [Actinoplanes palleronii]|uniref:Sensor-like histidine kinase SenX3 n=2 Tax=Actinoplanes palleronii TaxID=113570 RepID=A0ABQ4BJP8_9ACTN|nr:hypothetical protein Apa02nite_069810 [Actinoplanes palleronii]
MFVAAMGIEVDFRRVFESAPAALLVVDPDLRIVAASDAYLQATGTDRAMIMGRLIFDAFPDDPADPDADGVDNLRASLNRVRDNRVVDVMAIQKYPIVVPGRTDFETRYWAPMNSPVESPDGELLWIVHRAEDVTAYVQGQEDTLHAVLDSLDTAVVGCDSDGRAVLSNHIARDLFGLPPDAGPVDLWGQRFSHVAFSDPDGNAIAPDDLPVELLLRGEPVENMLVVAKGDRVAPRTLRVQGKPISDGGRLAAVLAVHEITRAQRAEQFKECGRQVAELLARADPADSLIKAATGLIGERLGWSAAEFWSVDQVGRVLRRSASWTAPEHQLPRELPDRLGKGIGIPGRAWKSNEPVWVADLDTDPAAAQQSRHWAPLRSALAVAIPSGALVLGVLVCYSDDPETPDDMRTTALTGLAAYLGEFLERRRADQFAAELEATRDEYIALVGHDLRTPLTLVQSYAEMMRDDPDMSAADRDDMLEVVHRRSGDLQVLIEKLLDVAGTRNGHITLQPRLVNLADLARAAAEQAERTSSRVTIDVNSPARVMINGDPGRLRNVVDELLHNALTWAPAGTVVGITAHADDHTAVLAVTNVGTRIPADEHARIFDLFYRTENTLHRGIPGNGLGLTLARAIVEQHGGTITVSEPEEATTTFIVRLPVT